MAILKHNVALCFTHHAHGHALDRNMKTDHTYQQKHREVADTIVNLVKGFTCGNGKIRWNAAPRATAWRISD